MTAPYPTDSYARKPFANTLESNGRSQNKTGTHFANRLVGRTNHYERLSIRDAVLECLSL